MNVMPLPLAIVLAGCGPRIEIISDYELQLHVVAPPGLTLPEGSAPTLTLQHLDGRSERMPLEEGVRAEDAPPLARTALDLRLAHPDGDWWGVSRRLTMDGGAWDVALQVAPVDALHWRGTLQLGGLALGSGATLDTDGDLWLFGGAESMYAPTPSVVHGRIQRWRRDLDATDAAYVTDMPELAPSPSPRVWSTATLLPSGLIAVAGGRPAVSPQLEGAAQGFLFDPRGDDVGDTFVDVRGRSEHVATVAEAGLYLWGGYDEQGRADGLDLSLLTPDLQVLGPWEVYGPGDVGHAMADLGGWGWLVCGGLTTTAADVQTPRPGCARVQLNQTAEPVIQQVADIPDGGRAFHTLTPLDDGSALLLGGISRPLPTAGTAAATASAWRYVPDTGNGTWEAVTLQMEPRAGHVSYRLTDGRVMVLGGATAVPGHGAITPPPLADCELHIDPSTWTVTELAGCDGFGGFRPRAWHQPPFEAILVEGAGGQHRWGMVPVPSDPQ